VTLVTPELRWTPSLNAAAATVVRRRELMHRSRLLLVVPAVSALVFTGIAPAAAHDGDHGDGDKHRASGEITEIDDTVEAEGRDRVEAEFEYECSGTHHGRADVHLYQRRGDVHYAGDVWLDCDGDEHWTSVDLYRESDDRVRNGRARLEVELYAGDRLLDEERERVTVTGARGGRDDDDDHEYHGGYHGDDDGDDDKHYGHDW